MDADNDRVWSGMRAYCMCLRRIVRATDVYEYSNPPEGKNVLAVYVMPPNIPAVPLVWVTDP